MEMDEPRSRFSLSSVRALWRRRRWTAIVVGAMACAAALSMVAFLPSVYTSAAVLLVERQQVPEGFARPSEPGDVEIRLYTVSQEILSRGRLKALIDRFALYPELGSKASPEVLVQQMRRDIRLNVKRGETSGGPGGQGGSIAFTVSYRGRDPAMVAEVTNALASFFVEENTRVRERRAIGTSKFLREQVAQTQKRLEEHERRLNEVKARYMGELPEQTDANRAALERYGSQLRLNFETQFRARERREALTRRLTEGGGPLASPDDPATRLLRLRQELAQLQTRYTDKYPDIPKARKEIASLEAQLAQAGSPAPSNEGDRPRRPTAQTLGEIDTELANLRDEEQRLQQAIATYQRRLENTPRSDRELKSLTRDYDATRELYLTMLKRQEDAELAETMEPRQRGELFRILDPALPAERPAAPNRLILALMGLAASVALGAAAAVLAERFDTSFHASEDLKAFTQVPLLASIPPIVTEVDTARRRQRFRKQAITVAVVLACIAAVASYMASGNEALVRLLTRGS